VLLDQHGNVVRLSTRPGVETRIERDGDTTRIWNTTRIPGAFLDGLQVQRNDATGRAPLGDSNGAWQKVAEIPLDLILEKLGGAANWEDEKAWKRTVNDSDFSRFRTDAPGRTF
jgi:hypothetical protein